MTALPEAALDLWRFAAHEHTTVRAAPDGCRDLIVVVPRIGAPACFVSALAMPATIGHEAARVLKISDTTPAGPVPHN